MCVSQKVAAGCRALAKKKKKKVECNKNEHIRTGPVEMQAAAKKLVENEIVEVFAKKKRDDLNRDHSPMIWHRQKMRRVLGFGFFSSKLFHNKDVTASANVVIDTFFGTD